MLEPAGIILVNATELMLDAVGCTGVAAATATLLAMMRLTNPWPSSPESPSGLRKQKINDRSNS
jgi:hypothetical protein